MNRDLHRSRAILIGNSTYRDPRIPDIPGASFGVKAMSSLLAGDLCGWPTDRIEELTDVASPSELARRILAAIKDVDSTGLLLFYYVGHGQRTTDGQLALTVGDTDPDPQALPHTAILYDSIAKILRGCQAATKLVILDCCHAELGTKANYQFLSVDLAEAYPVDGLYFIGASRTHEKAKASLSSGLTYFTRTFIEVVETGIPGKPSFLRLDQIFVELRGRMVRARLPEPVESGIRGAHQVPFARNAAPLETQIDYEQENRLLKERLALLERQQGAPQPAVDPLLPKPDLHGQPANGTGLWTEMLSALDAPAVLGRAKHARPHLIGGRYELDDIVAQGHTAQVYRARDLRLDRIVAVKTLRADLARDQNSQTRFRREAMSVASLNHPSIVAVYDTGEDMAGPAHVPYIVMEYVDGRTLRELLRDDRRLLPERPLEMTDGVLRALDYSHRNGIVHRDIKPGNVMLTRSGEIKVMGFGIARAVSDAQATMTQTARVIGTAQYLSPEQARGERVDARSDLYSTGCLLYELLVGRPPFTGESPIVIAYQHVRDNPIPPSRVDPEIPVWADSIVLKVMAKDPAERYQSAAEMRTDIQRALSGVPVAAPPQAGSTGILAPKDATTNSRIGGGLRRLVKGRTEAESSATPEPESKIVRQQPVRQSRTRRSGNS